MNRLVAVAVAVALLASAGCSDEPSTESPATGSVISTTTVPEGPASTLDGPVVTADPNGGVGEQALAVGTLDLVDGCLVMLEGNLIEVPVWPSGTTWDPATSEVVLSDGDRAGLGDQIEAGGGFRPGGGLIREVSDLEARKFAERCAREVGSGSVFVMRGAPDVIADAP